VGVVSLGLGSLVVIRGVSLILMIEELVNLIDYMIGDRID